MSLLYVVNAMPGMLEVLKIVNEHFAEQNEHHRRPTMTTETDEILHATAPVAAPASVKPRQAVLPAIKDQRDVATYAQRAIVRFGHNPTALRSLIALLQDAETEKAGA